MAAGMGYSDYTVLDEYPCDVESIVRYRGGFNFHAKALTTMKNYIFLPFSPMWVNLTTREVFPLLNSSWDESPDATISTATNYIVKAFLYNRVTVENGATVTLVLSANEVLFSSLQALRYPLGSSGALGVFEVYMNLTSSESQRTALMNAIPKCTYCWA